MQDGRPDSFALQGTPLRLYVEHEVDVRDDIAHTASYRYVLLLDRLAAGEDPRSTLSLAVGAKG